MRGLLALSRAIDRFTVGIGRAVAWLILLSVLVSAGNASMRKAFSISSNAWLELQWYLFGAAYLGAAAYTLQRNEHIRIDIVSGLLPQRARNWIDLLGHLLMLMPFTLVMIWESVPFVRSSLAQGERSMNAGGLIVWPAKAFILAGFLLLFLQGLSEIIKRVAVMRGLAPEPQAAVQTAHPAVQ